MLLIHSILRRLPALLALLAAFVANCAQEKPPKDDMSAAAQLDDVAIAGLGLLPDELLEEIIKHLLPENGLQDKPVDAIRFGSTCRHLHDLVLPLAFQVRAMLCLHCKKCADLPRELAQTLVIRDGARSTAWLADYLKLRGQHVRRLAVTMLTRGPNDAELISTCIKRCWNRNEVELRSLSAMSFDDPVFEVFSAIAHPGMQKLELTTTLARDGNSDCAAWLIRNCEHLRVLTIRDCEGDDIAPLTNAWQSLARLDTLSIHGTGPRYFASDRLSGVPPLRFLELNLLDVPLRSLRDFLELFVGTLSTCHITLAYSDSNASSHPDDDMSSVVLPLCTHLCVDAESAVALFSTVFDPATPLRTIEYKTARDNGMTEAIKSFYRRQRVETLELVRYQRHRSAPILVTEYLENRQELDQFKAWGKNVHVEVDVEDMYLKAFEFGLWP